MVRLVFGMSGGLVFTEYDAHCLYRCMGLCNTAAVGNHRVAADFPVRIGGSTLPAMAVLIVLSIGGFIGISSVFN